jgi:hypothetical protein
MSRVFFVSENKIYSIIFPFNIFIDGENITLNYKNLIEIDSVSITSLIILLNNPLIGSESCLDFIEPIIDIEDEQSISYWTVFRDLLLQEDGYIRYDMDESGYKEAKDKGKEHTHPLHHLDVFYTNQANFKIGLKDTIICEELIDVLDIRTNCKYLTN